MYIYIMAGCKKKHSKTQQNKIEEITNKFEEYYDYDDEENDYETTDWNKLDWEDFEIDVELEETLH